MSAPKSARPAQPDETPTFHAYASGWLQAKVDGVLGAKPIDANTESDYRWRICGHLLPFFAEDRLDRIDRQRCLAFKAHKLGEAQELRRALAAGADIRDRRGRRAVPLGPASLRKLIDTLAAILDDAVEDELIDRNPARGKRMRVRVPKPKRTFLEMDELAALLDAAASQDGPLRYPRAPEGLSGTAASVASLAASGLRPMQIASELGLAKSTVHLQLKHLGLEVPKGYVGRRVVCEVLGRSGVRASELCDLRIGEVRLHDPDGARFRIPDAKTDTGIREVQMSPDLVEAVIEHLDWLDRIGAPVGPDAYLVPNVRGGRLSRQRVAGVVGQAAAFASEGLQQRGLPPLPHTTPHSLRRTYISIALLANNFDVKWVMSQVGHANSKMTLDVYAQLEQRIERSHGTEFDRLVRNAREQLHGTPGGAATEGVLVPKWSWRARAASPRDQEQEPKREEPRDLQGSSEVARPGLEPGTPRFSVGDGDDFNWPICRAFPKAASRRLPVVSSGFRWVWATSALSWPQRGPG
jgi:integrase